ncbi:MAG: gamma-glutamyltransferase family protein [Hyphomicrobiales bacterium]|nr:gamma-glutamyltransferase family protein [Hyphomicrobiales bacterium]
MVQTARSTRGMVVAPHHLAAQAGLSVLREGGNAIEAMVAAAATIAVVYPHMNALGGDNFWLIGAGGQPPVGIDACGAAAGLARPELYRAQGHEAIPGRGPLAALTVAGAVSGWREALRLSLEWEGRLPLARLFEDAIHYARHGVPVTRTQAGNTQAKRGELEAVPGFADVFLPEGDAPPVGALFRQPKLAETLARLAEAGLDDFYRGDLARLMASELEAAGAPIRLADLEAHEARRVAPLAIQLADARVFNMPPPTQGLASLMILGIFERLDRPEPESFAYVHGLVEAAKRAFLVRDAHVTDPAHMTVDPNAFLTAAALAERARHIDPKRALPWPQPAAAGDTVWLGAVDGAGRAVSFIQSVYWEFGSGLVLPRSGVLWQNRGTSFALDAAHPNALAPGRKPFHTIQPAMALFADGRVMPYGTMGGEGQPQTQSMLYTRYALYGQGLQEAVSAPRWLLGRTWGADVTTLRLESRFPAALVTALGAAGHDVELTGPMDEVMGHAGALVRHADGTIEGASDPRSDGVAAGF